MALNAAQVTDPRAFVSRGLVAFARWLRAQKKPQRELAKVLGSSQPHVSMVVRHLIFPGPRLLQAIGVATAGASVPADWYVKASAKEVRDYRLMYPHAP